MITYRLQIIAEKGKFSFSEKTVLIALFWFIAALFVALIIIDGFVFYRYSYTVLNAAPEASISEIGLNERQLNQAVTILEERQTALQKLLGQ